MFCVFCVVRHKDFIVSALGLRFSLSMRDILEGLYTSDDEKGKYKAAWCSFFFYLFLLASVVLSIIASVRCSKVRNGPLWRNA